MSAWKVCLCAVVLAFSAACAKATIIDSFGGTKFTLSVDGDSIADETDFSQVTTAAAIGGHRYTLLTWLSGDQNFASVSPSGGKFSFTQGTAEGDATITWDGSTSSNVYLLGENLNNEGNEFQINVLGCTNTGVELTMTVYTNASEASTYSLPVTSIGGLSLPYKDFFKLPTAASEADFSSVGAIVLDINGYNHSGSDVTLGLIQTIPEPSTLALAAIFAVVALCLRRRWRRA